MDIVGTRNKHTTHYHLKKVKGIVQNIYSWCNSFHYNDYYDHYNDDYYGDSVYFAKNKKSHELP